MQNWLKLLIIVLIFMALGFFGTKFIKEKLDSTIEGHSNDSTSNGTSINSESGGKKSGSENFGSFGDLFEEG